MFKYQQKNYFLCIKKYFSMVKWNKKWLKNILSKHQIWCTYSTRNLEEKTNKQTGILGIWYPSEKINFFNYLGKQHNSVSYHTAGSFPTRRSANQGTAHQCAHSTVQRDSLTELRQLIIKVLHQKYLLLSSLRRLNDLKFSTNEFWISTKQEHCKMKGTVPLQCPVSQSSTATTSSTSEEQRIPVFPGTKV